MREDNSVEIAPSSDPMGGGGIRSPGSVASNGTASTAVVNGGTSPARSNGGGVSLQVRKEVGI